MKKFFILVIFLLTQHQSFAQIDTSYIGRFERNLSVKLYVVEQFSSLQQDFSKNNQVVMYMPNMPLGIGFGVAWRGTGISFAYGFDALREGKDKTHALDLQYHYYGRRLVADFFGQLYTGFYVEDGSNQNEFRSDITLTKVGVSMLYALNHTKFSPRASFGQNERQLKSAGSWLVGGSGYYTRIIADSAIVGKASGKSSCFLVGPNVGYSYTWVMKKDFFVAASLTTGFHVGFEDLNGKKVNLYPLFVPRISIGYNAETWSIGLLMLYNGTYVSYANDIHTSLNSGDVRLRFIKRFGMQSRFLDRLTLYRN